MAVWFTYLSDQYGWVWISEGPPDLPDALRQASWERDVATNPGTDGHDGCGIMVVREAVSAIACASDTGGGGLEFVQDDVQFHVIGPSLSRENLLDVGNGL
ncbi:MAG: hypothetical protein ABR600_06075 [Actinomycetota bacterium]